MSAMTLPPITLEVVRDHLYTAVVADALDAMGFRRQSPRVPFKPMTGVGKLVGRCKTTLWADMAHDDPNPYALELRAVDDCRMGDILIAAAGGSTRSGIWGELLSAAARNSGCAGAIIHGAVRDVEKIRLMGFGVFASDTCPYDSLHRQRAIDIDVPVEIDFVRFSPGDLVIADPDGVVVVPREVEVDVLRRAWEKVHAENQMRDAIKGGMKARDAFGQFGIL